MKIALVSPYDYPYPGGVTQHIHHLEGEFKRLGHEVKIMAPSSSGQEELARENVFKCGRVVSIPANGSVARITLSVHLSGRIKSFLERERFDIIHIHEPLLPALPLTVLHHSKAVNIGTFHANWGSNIAYFYAKPILKRFFNKLHGRIAVSQTARQFVARYFPSEYDIIPNGIDLSLFAQAEPLPELMDGKLNILFVGRLEKRKGVKYLLRAFTKVKREIPESRLVIVGAYNDKTKRRYQSVVDDAGLRDIDFVGFVPMERLARYYKSCTVFCAPSTGGESFGIVLLEAMAAGKPIVASSIEGYTSLIEQGREAFLVPPKKEEALAEGLLKLLKDEALREEMGKRGFLKAQKYSWSTIAAQILDLYQKALQNQSLLPVEKKRLRPSPLKTMGKLATRLLPSRE